LFTVCFQQIVCLTCAKATWDTPGFREYHRRMQLFILLYIEGGSYIQEDEEAWEFVLLCVSVCFIRALDLIFLRRYEKRKRRDDSGLSTYHFVGYSSLYNFYYYPEKTRLRLRFVPFYLQLSLVLSFS